MKLLPCRSRSTQRGWRGLVALVAIGGVGAVPATPLNEPIQPIPLASVQVPARVALGRRLFGDVRLSENGRVSCAGCHDLARGGVDGRARSIGLDGRLTEVNTPTVLNAALNFRQFWNGRAASLEAQIDEVIRNPVEMGSTWEGVVRRVSQDATYQAAFALAYADGVTPANIRNAIATFERTLITPESRFDRFLRGEGGAITTEEKAGYAAFKRYGCVACHQGVNVGGNMFQKFGVMANPAAPGAGTRTADQGRFAQTGRESDRHVFKVPSLRNVALTAPYFHDASARTLEDAVDVMFQVQLGRVPDRQERDSIVAFLHTLTGVLETQP
jgi:cytochrome c peroxidase